MMPTATQTPPSQQAPNQTAVLAALTVLLLSGASLAVILPPAIALLAPLGIGAKAVTEALELLIPNIPDSSFRKDEIPASASGHIHRTSAPRQAAYLLNASRRLSQGGSLVQERQYLSQHLNAERGRQEAAQRSDAAARMFGSILGWRAVLDSATTPACRQAHGNNYHFARPPAIGLPGSLHGSSCRCLPGPRWPDGGWVDEVVSATT